MDNQLLPPNLQLKQARERANWSIERVAFTLNLPSFAISALEEGNFDRLHGDAFVIGYMRAYAELFDLGSDELIRQYKLLAHAELQKDVDEAGIHSSRFSFSLKHQKYRTGYGIAAAVTLIASLSMLSPQDVLQDKPENQGISVETSVGTTLIDSMESLPVENPTQDMIPQVVVEQDISQDGIELQLKNRILGAVSSGSSSLIDKSLLTFRFSADCWVEIRDGDNQIIFASLQKAQESFELSGKPPFHITLGYAPGVDLSYNGQPVQIDASRENIARLVLGNS